MAGKKTWKLSQYDYYLLFALLALTGLGLVMILSASYVSSYHTKDNPYYLFQKQFLWAILGMGAMFGISVFDYQKLRRMALPFFGISVFLLIVVLLAAERKGASSWLNLGFASFQPSELAKLSLVITLALLLSRKMDKMRSFQNGLLPALIIVAVFCVLVILEKDLGVTMAMAFTSFILLYASGARLWHLAVLAMGGVGLSVAAVKAAPYRFDRVISFFHLWDDPKDKGYQVIQSLYAIGSGGFWGQGLGQSMQKFWIPEQHNDFIFSILTEELGFLGGVAVVALFVLLAARGLKIAREAPDNFGRMLATGIVAMIVIEAIMNISVVTHSMPATGITLPFVSYGGSSLLFKMAGMGILLNIARQRKAWEEGVLRRNYEA